MTDIIAIVPARGGSQRLQGKNLLALGGHSLLAWTAAVARRALGDTPVLLTTDDAAIAEEGQRQGLLAPFSRPASLATSSSPTAAAVLHALDWWSDEHGREPDIVVLLQPTSPFRPPELVRDGVARVARKTDADALISVRPMHLGSGAVFAEHDGFLQCVDPDCRFRQCVVPSGALYVIRTAVLRATGSFVPPKTASLEHSGISALDIDTLDDWSLAEAAVAAGIVAFPGAGPKEAQRTASA